MADDLHYRTVNIRRLDRSIFLQVYHGFDDEASVRGVDDVLLYADGRRRRSRWKDVRIIELRGWVQGLGDTLTVRRQAYRARINELHAIFEPDLDPGPLVISAPYMGLVSGTATIQARFLNASWDEPVLGYFRRVSVELECISSPPEWTLAA